MQLTCIRVSSLVFFLLLASLAFGQGVGTSGDIVGQVVDPTGAVVAQVTVTAVETARESSTTR